MKKLLQLVCLLVVALTASHCATIVRGTSQDISANSNPAGARIVVNGEDKGMTPTTLTLKRNRSYQIVFKLDGYEDVTINMDRQFKITAAIGGNFFSWGLIGIVVDVANGSAYQLTPEELDVTLRRTGSTTSASTDRDHVQVFFFTPDKVQWTKQE